MIKAKKMCPRCGQRALDPVEVRNSLSRHQKNTYICNVCGTDEAMRDAFGMTLPYEEWYVNTGAEIEE